MQPSAYLLVERGDPYEVGTRIDIDTNEVYLGRSSGAIKVDVSFSNFLISRRHCSIKLNDKELVLSDLGSKHGTTLNGKKIIPHQAYPLNNGDKIGLAMGMAMVRFIKSQEYEETLDFSNTLAMAFNKNSAIILDVAKRECIVDGKDITLAEKEWSFISLLYENTNKLVTYAKIKTAVWPERSAGLEQVPDVGMDEINVLIYRLRKKLGKRAKLIKTVRGCGCILEA